jgi:hypothetical protein
MLVVYWPPTGEVPISAFYSTPAAGQEIRKVIKYAHGDILSFIAIRTSSCGQLQ